MYSSGASSTTVVVSQSSSKPQCLGIVRNRFHKFNTLRCKSQSLEDGMRFKDKTAEMESSLTENGKTSLLGKKKDGSCSSKSLELTAQMHNRLYMDIFNATNVIYEDLKQNFATIQQEQQKRIIPKFDDAENQQIDKRIKELVIDMTRKVRHCEENIRQLSKMKLNSPSEDAVKENMKINLAEKIRDFSKEFKLNEERYMKNYQELVGDHDVIQIDSSDSNNYFTSTGTNISNSNKNDFLQIKVDLTLKKRDEEISTLLTSITELGSIFKDLQVLVQHQGTILDRIDYNIESSLQNTKDAHKHLVSTDKLMKVNCYRNSMLVVIIMIFIFGILLLLKFT